MVRSREETKKMKKKTTFGSKRTFLIVWSQNNSLYHIYLVTTYFSLDKSRVNSVTKYTAVHGMCLNFTRNFYILRHFLSFILHNQTQCPCDTLYLASISHIPSALTQPHFAFNYTELTHIYTCPVLRQFF